MFPEEAQEVVGQGAPAGGFILLGGQFNALAHDGEFLDAAEEGGSFIEQPRGLGAGFFQLGADAFEHGGEPGFDTVVGFEVEENGHVAGGRSGDDFAQAGGFARAARAEEGDVRMLQSTEQAGDEIGARVEVVFGYGRADLNVHAVDKLRIIFNAQ